MVEYELRRGDVEGKKIIFSRGLGQGHISNPAVERDYGASERELERLVERGEIDKGVRSPYDDRKLRWNTPIVNENSVEIPLGLTYFQAWKKDLDLSQKEGNPLEDVKNRGYISYGDPMAFLSRATGVTAILMTREGYAVIGKRANSELGGLWNGPAGYLNFRGNGAEDTDAVTDAINEIEEELNVPGDSLVTQLQLLGAAHNGVDYGPDLIYLARTQLTSHEVENAWKNAQDKEMAKLAFVKNQYERDILLRVGSLESTGNVELMPGTHAVLEQLTSFDFRKLI